jgi:porphobilinogen synthase
MSCDVLLEEAGNLLELGVKSVLLFGIPAEKDDLGEVACDEQGVVQETIRALKSSLPDIVVIADLCFCEYTSHGHCGVLVDGDVENDLTLQQIRKQAISLARAGADVVAPSGMIDGMVMAIRETLEEEYFPNVVIMSYAAKFASAFYGPFREAADCAPSSGNRKTYQMDPANGNEAMREIEQDIEEGADIVMVKPALAYLDVISRARDAFAVPIAAYNVSGEYAMVKAAAQKGLLDHEQAMLETLQAIKRAGADLIITYFAKEAAPLLCR